jgi:hypothetical protein
LLDSGRASAIDEQVAVDIAIPEDKEQLIVDFDVLTGLADLDAHVRLVPKPSSPNVLLEGVRKALGR